MKWQAAALHEADNVATMLQPIAAGATVSVLLGAATIEVVALEPIPLCHKIALEDLREGDHLIKYGECIGEAISPIRRGAWVHTHNLRSLRARKHG